MNRYVFNNFEAMMYLYLKYKYNYDFFLKDVFRLYSVIFTGMNYASNIFEY